MQNAEKDGKTISKEDIGRNENREKIYCTWDEIEDLIKNLGDQLSKSNKKYDYILGIANGGMIPARLLSAELGIELTEPIRVHNGVLDESEMPFLFSDDKKKYLIVDDIYDTGETYRRVLQATKGFDCDFAFCMSRYYQIYGFCSKILDHEKWVVFPWESMSTKNDVSSSNNQKYARISNQ